MVIASPDVGGAKRANSYAKYFDVPLVLCHKVRAKANVVENITVIGDVKDKNVILVDDIVDTAGTITKAADMLLSFGAASVRALCSHAVMSDPATERVQKSGLTEIIFTDSIPYGRENDKAMILPVAKLLPIPFAASIITSRFLHSIFSNKKTSGSRFKFWNLCISALNLELSTLIFNERLQIHASARPFPIQSP